MGLEARQGQVQHLLTQRSSLNDSPHLPEPDVLSQKSLKISKPPSQFSADLALRMIDSNWQNKEVNDGIEYCEFGGRRLQHHGRSKEPSQRSNR